jgi:hypothetical protein
VTEGFIKNIMSPSVTLILYKDMARTLKSDNNKRQDCPSMRKALSQSLSVTISLLGTHHEKKCIQMLHRTIFMLESSSIKYNMQNEVQTWRVSGSRSVIARIM